MSFQDVGKRNSNRQPVNAAMKGGSSSSSGFGGGPSSVFASMSSGVSAASVTAQISDSLTQYHRNVGILEKIAQALLANNNSIQREELEQQYKAQSDVLRELESRLKEQILGQRQRLQNQSQTSAQKQALSKLERDFERVQSTVTALKARVNKHAKQYQQRGGTSISNENSNNNNKALSALQQQQILLQQDRLQEEIMREREEEIRKINQGMHQVNQIYKDLAHIVGEQQEHVDAIEDKMEDSKTAAQSGLDQIHKANEKYGAGNANCQIM
jgi:t-SNARE complex subunit (syntaxin)